MPLGSALCESPTSSPGARLGPAAYWEHCDGALCHHLKRETRGKELQDGRVYWGFAPGQEVFAKVCRAWSVEMCCCGGWKESEGGRRKRKEEEGGERRRKSEKVVEKCEERKR